MKNKKLNYILLPLAIGIWAYAIYFLVQPYFRESGTTNASQLAVPITVKSGIATDTFSLLLNYPDPFTKIPKAIKAISPAVPVVKPAKPRPKASLMPTFKYKGFIAKQNASGKTGIFSVNGKQVFLQENQEFNGITILAIKNSEVTVKWENEKLIFPLHGK